MALIIMLIVDTRLRAWNINYKPKRLERFRQLDATVFAGKVTLLLIGAVSGRGGLGGLAPPQTLDRGQYFALMLFKLHEI